MSALSSGLGVAPQLVSPPQKAKGFLHIERHGAGPNAIYVVTYHRLESQNLPNPALAESAQSLIELLERIGVDFRVSEVRGALQDILRLGSANIPDLWLSDDEMVEKGLVENG